MTTFQKHDSTMLMGRAPAQRWDAPAPRRGPRTRRLPLVVVAVMASVLCHAGAVGAATTKPATTKTSYEASSETIANPERGFYHHPGDCDDDKNDFDVTTLKNYRMNKKISLVLCIFYLREFKTSLISPSQLTQFANQADAVRDAGLKMIVRFAYTDSNAGDTADDASPEWVQKHLDQLAPLLKSKRNVIAVVESGFVGAWGEGYYTKNFGNKGVISPTDWANRKAIVEKLLTIVPRGMVQVRTPKMKRQMYGITPVSSGNAYGTASVARVGHHNDCFLASDTDQGTYENISVEKPYLAADTKYVAMGGETCVPNPPRSECPTALQELGMFHYSYLNSDRSLEVLGSWIAGGCMEQVEQRLGYRLSLTSSQFPTSVTSGSTFKAQFSIRNTGWAAPLHSRPVHLVLRNKATPSVVYKLKLAADPRRWQPEMSVLVAEKVRIPPTIPAGDYDLLLSLPEPSHSLPGKPVPAGSLTTRPEYAIQFANTGVWEENTGFNRLLRTIKVKPEVAAFRTWRPH